MWWNILGKSGNLVVILGPGRISCMWQCIYPGIHSHLHAVPRIQYQLYVLQMRLTKFIPVHLRWYENCPFCFLFQLLTLFSAPNYCGEFDNAGAVMRVTDDLTCSFKILEVFIFDYINPLHFCFMIEGFTFKYQWFFINFKCLVCSYRFNNHISFFWSLYELRRQKFSLNNCCQYLLIFCNLVMINFPFTAKNRENCSCNKRKEIKWTYL